eukprot:6472788-Amphidinium_carterae.7
MCTLFADFNAPPDNASAFGRRSLRNVCHETCLPNQVSITQVCVLTDCPQPSLCALSKKFPNTSEEEG